MRHYGTCSDDFYVNLNVNTEMELNHQRETVLHFFEQLQKKHASMNNFYCRDRGEFLLEEDKDRGHYRWAAVELKRICSGYVNPSSVQDALDLHKFVLELAPYSLSISRLDCESVNLMYGFDYTYRGNHNELVADALGITPAFDFISELDNATPVSYEPSIQFALDDECRTQCRLSIETRTSAYHVKTGEFPEEQLSVYVTARRYGSLDSGQTFVDVLDQLTDICRKFVDDYVMESVLLPLQQTIAMK